MGINVLSCFDGISAGQLALQTAGVDVDCYFASEIDKYAIAITQNNFPKTIQLGDIENWRSWNLPKIDLVIAGSPCQGFSNAGRGLNFDDPRSKLFFVFCDILEDQLEKNPNLKFLLENVKMKKEWRDTITEYMKVEPVLINSALVSAQNRQRLYWANWSFPQPKDRFIFLKDILEDDMGILVRGAAIRNQTTNRGVKEQLNVRKDRKSNCVVPSYSAKLNGAIQIGMASDIKGKDQWRRIYSVDGKSPTVVGSSGGHHEPKISTIEVRRNGHGYVPTEIKMASKSDTLREATPYNYGARKKSKTVRVGGINSPAGSKQEWDMISKDDYHRLSVVECERLQTMPDGYTEIGVFNGVEKKISNTQRYKCIGNSWTVDVIAHILLYSGL